MYVTQYIIGCLLSFQDTTHTHTKKKRIPRLPYLKSITGRGKRAILIIFFVRRKKKLTHHFVTIWLYIVSRSVQICRVRKLTWHRLEARNPCKMHIRRSADEARKMCSLGVLVSFGGLGFHTIEMQHLY